LNEEKSEVVQCFDSDAKHVSGLASPRFDRLTTRASKRGDEDILLIPTLRLKPKKITQRNERVFPKPFHAPTMGKLISKESFTLRAEPGAQSGSMAWLSGIHGIRSSRPALKLPQPDPTPNGNRTPSASLTAPLRSRT